MRYGSVFFGALILLIGAAFLGGNLLNVDVWPFLIPVILIFVGLWLLFRARMGPEPRGTEDVTIPLQGAGRAELRIRHGAGRLTISGGAGSQDLATGSFSGGLSHKESRNGDLLNAEMRVPEDVWFRGGTPWIGGSWSPINWDIRLNTAVPLKLDLETGAGEYRIDLSGVRAEDIRLKTGASSSELILPENAGRTRVRVASGAASVVIRVPDAVAANIRVQSGLADIKVDERRFPRSGSGYTSADYPQADNVAEIEVETGVGSVDIR
jgi:hypothetical protein